MRDPNIIRPEIARLLKIQITDAKYRNDSFALLRASKIGPEILHEQEVCKIN